MRYGQAGEFQHYAAAPTPSLVAGRLAFLRKVYGLFSASLVFSALGALVALYAGTGVSRAVIPTPDGALVVPPLVAFFAQHWIVGLVLMMGAVFGASFVRRVPGINVAALFGMATLLGVIFAPALFWAQVAAGMGGTISAHPIRDAFLLAVAAFAGLSGYALLARKDFSYLAGFLSMGLIVVIGAIVLNLFVGSSVLGLAIASACVLLFGAFVLYDTSRLLRSDESDAVGGALSLYLDFINLFLALLRILGARRE
ncbi:MAG: Bax inhibitor-1/YccA family protein [Deltaproteobacteria bacterium]|nr:Bax inhibitor-1/YccA family protein [Deltaproteobacteria bacterium]